MTAPLPGDDAPRDFIGYGPTPPDPRWPNGARVAVQFVLNYEEGGERSVLDGDPHAEVFLSEIAGALPFPNRHMSMESLYEYGARAGVWRILRLFRERGVPLTIFGVAQALARNPMVVEAFLRDDHEIAGHGWRWLSYQDVPEEIEREHLARAVETIQGLTGQKLLGWYTGRDSPNTRRLVVDQGGFLYDSDSYADDLPYWVRVGGKQHLVVPYTLDTNDMRFSVPGGFPTASSSSRICATPSIASTRRAPPRRRCSPSGCIAASSGAPRGCRPSPASSTTC